MSSSYFPTRYCRLIDIIARPYPRPSQFKFLHNPYKPYQFRLSAPGSIGSWSQKASLMSNSRSTDLPPGTWDSHVHVVDEVSSVVQALILITEITRRTHSPSQKITLSARRKQPSRTCWSSRISLVPIMSALSPYRSMERTTTCYSSLFVI